MNPSKTPRPNILFLFTDQHRWDYVGYAGANFVKTPNIDRLAAQGTRFSRTYTNCPICAPARIALATGQAAFRVAPQSNSSFLPLSRPTYYQRLRDHGYEVGVVGKLDLSKASDNISLDGNRPLLYSIGFTRSFETEGKWNAGVVPRVHGPYTALLAERGLFEDFHSDYKSRAKVRYPTDVWDSILPEELFQDTYIADKSVDWIDQTSGQYPWHLFVSFAGPHDPFDPPKRFADQCRDRAVPPAIQSDPTGKAGWLQKRRSKSTPEQTTRARQQYVAAIEAIDEGIGKILDALDRKGMRENTIIVFSSDHGEALGDHDMWEKQVAYEGSSRIPLFISGPGIPQGDSAELVELIDLAPTICELAGVKPIENCDARSLAPLLRGETTEHRSSALITMPNFSCVRTDQWKFIDNINDKPELYDLKADPEEKHNVADSQPEVRNKMWALLRKRLMEGGCFR